MYACMCGTHRVLNLKTATNNIGMRKGILLELFVPNSLFPITKLCGQRSRRLFIFRFQQDLLLFAALSSVNWTGMVSRRKNIFEDCHDRKMTSFPEVSPLALSHSQFPNSCKFMRFNLILTNLNLNLSIN